VCVPSDPALDARRVEAWRARGPDTGQLIHLGLHADGELPWQGLSGLVSLGALFDMLRSQSELRRRALERARRACLEKALLRSLGASSSHPHSWEDLAAFASI
jgi:hypothetical protein